MPKNLKQYIEKNPTGLAARAFNFANVAHQNQKRKTGEPYIVHPLAVAETLLSWNMDEATIAAGLLHDVVEDTPVSEEHVRKEFGEDVAFLVDGVTKLNRFKFAESTKGKAESLRKMIVALSEDLRVVFVKLADRLHNMQTLSALPIAKQKRIALETEEIYAPLAYRLGMQNVSGELADLAFPYLYPKEYEWLRQNVPEEYEKSLKYAESLKSTLEAILAQQGISTAQIDFRAKRWSSLYRKLQKYDMDLNKIYDLIAVRILLNSAEECYAALGLVHSLWTPLPGRIKDYIAMPKPNGYRSLHTTVIAQKQRIAEIQIRTRAMHIENENGIAAHWLYKSGEARRAEEELKWVKQLREWQSQLQKAGVESQEFLDALKGDFFKGRIFVITPKGEVIDLPIGSTPVDFAYTIHTQIGHSCTGAKVNGGIAPLSHELKSGDMVQIMTQKNKLPSEDWLDFVKTSIAREHIKAALHKKRGSLQTRLT